MDFRCDDGRLWLSAQDRQVPTPTSQNVEVEQQILALELQNEELSQCPCLTACVRRQTYSSMAQKMEIHNP